MSNEKLLSDIQQTILVFHKKNNLLDMSYTSLCYSRLLQHDG